MCGIVGQVREDGRSVDAALVARMCAGLEHRGPDSRGMHVHERAGLGIQRLRVIDLETGDQPIYNEDGSIAVVLNGEIYNFQELRERLQRNGHVFKTHGDTEVIVHLYEEEGPDCVRSLHGMFALALWDEREQRLVVARDRVGKKPLFYHERDGVLTFASELGALMQNGDIPREPDHQALDCFLAYQYVPSPLSAFKGVRKLPPASILVWQDGIRRIDRYWRLDYSRKRRFADPREAHEEILEGIRRAVRRRMIADVPLGAFLSGGIDSSAVVAAMAEASSQPVRTFSIGFENESFNELEHARTVARLFDTEHREFVVRPDAVEIVPKIVRHYGEPFADSSAIPSFYLAELTRRHVTVALNGDGGDESFAGYTRYVANTMAHRLERLPSPMRRAISAVGHRIPPNADIQSTLNRARRLSRSLSLDAPARYARHMSYFDFLDRESLYTPEYKDMIGESLAPGVIAEPWHRASGSSIVDVMLEVDVETYLPGDLLVKVDIATMAYSLEARSPLLDPEFMELAASLPADMKLQGLEKKVALRAALRSWLPDEILDRPKMGFGVPIVDWFRHDLREYVEEILLDRVARDRGYFSERYVRALLDRHILGVEDNSYKIWALLMYELWQREFVDGPLRVPAAAAA
jgi:asparagine synthase (glutamine-hydrolysing)